MSRIVDIPAVLPVSSSAVLDLEGIELTIESASSTGSSDSFKITDGYFAQDGSRNNFYDPEEGADDGENVLVQSAEFAVEKKRNLRLNLKEHGVISRSFSTPTSPNSSHSVPPVPPRRTKSKINRNRLLSNKKRPEAAVFDTNDKSLCDFGSPGGINSDDLSNALAQVAVHIHNVAQSESLNSSPVSMSQDSFMSEVHQSSMKTSYVTEADGEVGPSIDDLRNQITTLKEELSRQKDRYKTQATALTAQIADMKEKYERRIETMEVEFRSQIRELENKLSNEKESCAAAIANNAKLACEIHKYQILYGELL